MTLLSSNGFATELIGGRCEMCGEVSFPARNWCTGCGEPHIMPERLVGVGILYSYTVVHLGRPGVAVPYALGIADLTAGVRVVARIEQWDRGLRIGAKVTVQPAPAEECQEDDRANLRLRVEEG